MKSNISVPQARVQSGNSGVLHQQNLNPAKPQPPGNQQAYFSIKSSPTKITGDAKAFTKRFQGIINALKDTSEKLVNNTQESPVDVALKSLSDNDFLGMLYSCAYSQKKYDLPPWLNMFIHPNDNIEGVPWPPYKIYAEMFFKMQQRLEKMYFAKHLYGINDQEMSTIKENLKLAVEMATKYSELSPATKSASATINPTDEKRGELHKKISDIALEMNNLTKLLKGITPGNEDGMGRMVGHTSRVAKSFAGNTVLTASDITGDNPGASIGFGMAAQAATALLLGIPANMHSEVELCIKQKIRVHKYYLLAAIKEFNKLGGTLHEAEKKYIGRLMQIKCAKPIANIFTSTTDSYKLFLELTKPNSKQPVSSTGNASGIPDAGESHIVLKHTIKEFLRNKNYSGLKTYLDKFASNAKSQGSLNSTGSSAQDNSISKQLPDMVFKLNGFRGNLLSHLLKSPTLGKIGNDLLTTCISFSDEHEMVKFCRDGSYEQIRLNLMNYKVNSKYTVLADFQHMILGVLKNTNLSDAQKTDLRNYLVDEVKRTTDGQFHEISRFRNLPVRNAVVQLLALEGYSVKRTLGIVFGSSMTIDPIASGIGNGLFALLPGIDEFCKISGIYRTTTYKSAITILADDTAQILNGVVNMKANLSGTQEYKSSISLPSAAVTQGSVDSAASVGNIPNTQSNPPSILPSVSNTAQPSAPNSAKVGTKSDDSKTVNEIVNEISQNLQKNDFPAICKQLKECNKNLHYCVLTSRYKNNFLINQLFASVPDTNKDELFSYWSLSVETTAMAGVNIGKNEINNLEKTLCEKELNDKKAEIINDLDQFKRFVANIPQFISTTHGLMHFYTIMAMIKMDTDQNRKAQKLDYFAGICYRAKFDPTSSWYDLRKRGDFETFFIRNGMRLTTAILWGGSSAAILAATHGLAAPVVIGLQSGALALINALRAVGNGVAENITHKDTPEYIQVIDCINNLKPDDAAQKKLNAVPVTPPKPQSGATTVNKQVASSEPILNAWTRDPDKVLCDELVRLGSAIRDQRNKKSQRLHGLNDYLKDRLDPKFGSDRDKYITPLDQCTDDNMRQQTIYQIYQSLRAGVADKYLESEALFRLIRIIKLSTLEAKTKFEFLLQLAFIYSNKGKIIAPRTMQERSSLTEQNYFANQALSGALGSISIGVSAFGMSGVANFVTGGTSDWLGEYLTLDSNADQLHNTRSYQEIMTIFKHILMDMMWELKPTPVNIANQTSGQNDQIINGLETKLQEFLNINTGRFNFINLFTTPQSMNHYQVSINQVKSA